MEFHPPGSSSSSRRLRRCSPGRRFRPSAPRQHDCGHLKAARSGPIGHASVSSSPPARPHQLRPPVLPSSCLRLRQRSSRGLPHTPVFPHLCCGHKWDCERTDPNIQIRNGLRAQPRRDDMRTVRNQRDIVSCSCGRSTKPPVCGVNVTRLPWRQTWTGIPALGTVSGGCCGDQDHTQGSSCCPLDPGSNSSLVTLSSSDHSFTGLEAASDWLPLTKLSRAPLSSRARRLARVTA